MSDQRTLYEKVESTDDYRRWKAVYDAWVDDPATAINLRDFVGEYFDDFMVPVEEETELRWCLTHGQERIRCEHARQLFDCAKVVDVAVVQIDPER